MHQHQFILVMLFRHWRPSYDG